MFLPVSTFTQGNQHSDLSAWIGLPGLKLHVNSLSEGWTHTYSLSVKGMMTMG